MEEHYLLAGNVIAWLGLGCYLFWLMRQAVRLERRLDRLEALRDE